MLCRALLVAICLPAVARAEPADRVVAVVEDDLILSSDVQLDAALTPFDDALPFWREPREPASDKLIDAAAVRAVAGTVALYQPDDDDVSARAQQVRDAAARTDGDLLARWGVDDDRLTTWVRRRLIVERYLQRSVQAPVTDPDAWWAEVTPLLQAARARTRVRVVPPQP